jgi:hypothetical protein
MSDLYKADASNFSREQLIELINHQTQLHIEGSAILIIAKKEIESLQAQLAEKNQLIVEARTWVSNLWDTTCAGTKSHHDYDEWLEKTKGVE